MSNIKTVLSVLDRLAGSNSRAQQWKFGFSNVINPRIELSQAAIYISKSEDSYMDAELEVFMVQVAAENNWFDSGKMEKLDEEKKRLKKSVHKFLAEITEQFNRSKDILYNLDNYSTEEINVALSYYNTNKGFLGGLSDNKILEFTDRVAQIYKITDILKPIATALLIHNYLIEDYNGSYEKRYDKLNDELSKVGYSLGQDDKLLLEIKNNSSKIQYTIDKLEDYIIK